MELAEIMSEEFWDEAGGGFFYTGRSHERLIAQSKPIFDGSIPSGNAVATQVLLRLYHYTGKEDYLKRAERILRAYYNAMESQPFGFAHMLAALDLSTETEGSRLGWREERTQDTGTIDQNSFAVRA